MNMQQVSNYDFTVLLQGQCDRIRNGWFALMKKKCARNIDDNYSAVHEYLDSLHSFAVMARQRNQQEILGLHRSLFTFCISCHILKHEGKLLQCATWHSVKGKVKVKGKT